jgi:pyruvate dehydrogenase E1 component alpha subunit
MLCFSTEEDGSFTENSYTRADRAVAAKSIPSRSVAYDMRGMVADGNDVVAVFLAANEAIENARHGQGPTLLKYVTYKLKGHGVYDSRHFHGNENRNRQDRRACRDNEKGEHATV